MKAPIEQRLADAIKKLETRHDSIPEGERVFENQDYTRLVMVIDTLKKYRDTIDKIHLKLDQLDAPRTA